MANPSSEKKSASLVNLNHRLSRQDELHFWQNLQTQLGIEENACAELDLSDLFCRIDRTSFLIAVKQIWKWASDFAILNISLPHPRHDYFLNDLGYFNALLPETFLELDPQNSFLGLHHDLGVRYEVQETRFEFNPFYENEKMEDLERLSKTNNNVIVLFHQKIIIRKSLWVETSTENLGQQMVTPDIEKQLREQYQVAVNRGDLAAAEVIQKFLKDNNK